jgi:DHA2 family multidrug resistance protein
MFVPLTTLTLAQLSPRDLPQGVGLYSFFRQLGGSFGIAGIATLVVRYTAQLRSMLAEHVGATDPSAIARVEAMTRAMMGQGADAFTARQRALNILDRQLIGQASVIAYSKIYVLAAALMLLLIPLLALVRRPRAAASGHVVME